MTKKTRARPPSPYKSLVVNVVSFPHRDLGHWQGPITTYTPWHSVQRVSKLPTGIEPNSTRTSRAAPRKMLHIFRRPLGFYFYSRTLGLRRLVVFANIVSVTGPFTWVTTRIVVLSGLARNVTLTGQRKWTFLFRPITFSFFLRQRLIVGTVRGANGGHYRRRV